MKEGKVNKKKIRGRYYNMWWRKWKNVKNECENKICLNMKEKKERKDGKREFEI